MARSRKKIQKNITSMLKSHRSRRHLVLGVIPVALILITVVTWSLHVNAITQSNDPICGQEEHTHTADCYAWVAVDDNTETAGTITTAASSSQNEITGTETVNETETETESEPLTEELTESETAAEAVTEEEIAAEAVIEEEISETATESVIPEGTEAIYVSTETEAAEEVEVTPQEGETKIEDGVMYVYTCICGKEEHTHVDECFEDESESIRTKFGIMLMSAGEEGSEMETGSETETASETETGSETERVSETEKASETETPMILSVTAASTVSSSYMYTDISDADSLLSDSEVEWTAEKASYADGSFTVELVTSFTITGTDVAKIGDEYAAYYIPVPDGFSVSESSLNVQYTAYDSSNEPAYHYYFRVDSNGSYYIEIVFDVEDYITANGSSTNRLTGTISYTQYTIDADNTEYDSSEEKITFNDSLDIEISATKVEKEENESWLQDLTVTKTASSYDVENNCITYTVTISSYSGTDVITLTDLLNFVNNQTYTNDMSISSITVDDVTYQQCYYYTNNYGYWTMWKSDIVSSATGSNDITSSTAAGSSYYADTDGSGESNVSITLAPLAGATKNAENYSDSTETVSDEYVITYTVYFADGTTYDSKVTDNAMATSEKDGDTVTDTASVTTKVVSSTVEKSYSYDADTGLITWKITLNENGTDISGYVLKDNMFAEAVDGIITLTWSDSSEDSGTSSAYTVENTNGDYQLITNSDGSVDIKILAITDTNGDNIADSNTRTYTITYQTQADISMGENSSWVYNEVDVYNAEGTKADEDSNSVNVYSGGSVEKSVKAETDTVTSGDVTTRALDWTSTLTVPSTGIEGGSTIVDYLGNSWNYTDLSTTKQWYTYTQITNFLGSLATNGITITSTDDTTAAAIGYESGNNYTLYAYDATTGTWVEYSVLTASGGTGYSSDRFTAWKIELAGSTNIDGPGTIKFSYSSTADITSIDVSQNYTNYIYINNMSANATYTEYEKVYKTDGSGNTGTTTTEVTDGDGTVTWKVYVNVSGLTSTSGDIVITDTLPSGVSLTSLAIALGWSQSTTITMNDNTTSYTGQLYVNSGNVEVSVTLTSNENGTTTVAATVPDDAYYIVSNSSNPYIILTYTTTIDDWGTEWTNLTQGKTGEDVTYKLNNEVSVTLSGSNYGSDNQEQDITHKYVETGQTTAYTHDEVEKSVDTSGFGGDNLIDYQVLINLDGEELNSGNNLTFTDVMYTYYGLHAELIYSSVKFYKLVKTTETTGTSIYTYTESDGTYTYYKKVKLDIDWDFAESYAYAWSTTEINHTLTAEVPDSTPILVEYSYFITYDYGNGSYIYLKNTATLEGDSSVIGSETDEGGLSYKEYTTSGSITNAGGLTVIKSGLHTSNFIEGVTFALYKYNSGTWIDTGIVYTTNSSGSFSVTPYTDTEKEYTYDWYSPNTLYYLVETSTPSGYLLDSDTKYYFYWEDTSAGADPSTVEYPKDWDYSAAVSVITETSATRLNVSNTPITTFSLTKTDTSDSTAVLSGATFGLYEYGGLDNSGEKVWIRIGTYVSDSNGKISITYNENLYAFNKAYMITEINPADGYNIAWGDVTKFYFYWSSDLYDDQPQPDGWGTDTTYTTAAAGTTYAAAIDISSKSQSVTATNTKTTTTISTKKVWIDENGNSVTDDDYSAEVQLYYYLGDENGTPFNTASSGGEIVTLTTTSGTEADTTIKLYENTTSKSLDNNSWSYLFWESSGLLSAIYKEAYTDSYIEVVVSGGDTPDNMGLIIAVYRNGETSTTNIAVYPSEVTEEVENQTSYYTVKYSVDSIKFAISGAGYSESEIAGYNVFLDASGLTTAGTLQSMNVLGSAVTTSDVTSNTYTFGSSNTWYEFFYSPTYLSQNGAVLAIEYSGATAASTIQVGTAFSDESGTSSIVTLPATSGTVYVSVSDLIGTSEVNWDNYEKTWIQSVTWNTDNYSYLNTSNSTKINSVTVLLPATATTTTQQYVKKKTDDTSVSLSSWLKYFYGDSEAAGYLDTDEAVIYINYTCSSVPTWANIGVQYTTSVSGSTDYDQYTITSFFSTGTNDELVIPVSDILSGNYDLSNYNLLYLQGDGTVTINSVSILIPYSAAAEVSGTLIDTDYTVNLYAPTLGTLNYYNNTTVDEVTYSSYAWNTISSRAAEPTIDAASINGTSDSNTFTGYAFLDAIYANTSSTVEIELRNVTSNSADLVTELENMQLIIQGDLSTGTEGYTSIASVTPTKVKYDKEASTYTLIYSSGDIVSSLANSTANYASASDAYADYNALVLSLTGDTQSSISAAIDSLTVVSETLNTANTYTESTLIGTIYGGEPYTDSSGNTCTYTLDKDNNWTVALYNLPLTCTVNGVTYYYYYYFVETEYAGGATAYTVTYSQTEGENGGGEIVITNITTTYELPGSGGIGTGIFHICGMLILGLGVVLIIILKIQPNGCLCFSRNRRTTIRKRQKRSENEI